VHRRAAVPAVTGGDMQHGAVDERRHRVLSICGAACFFGLTFPRYSAEK
jgi:hypothetical protein